MHYIYAVHNFPFIKGFKYPILCSAYMPCIPKELKIISLYHIVSKAIKILLIIILAYLFVPSYAIAIAIKMPFPYILFPPIGKQLLYDEENYNCLHQNEEVEKFLEWHGIHVYGKSGYWAKDGKLMVKINTTTGEIDYDFLGDYEGHRWLSIDCGFFEIPFDATIMLPVDPSWYRRFNVITKDEGRWYGKYEVNRVNEEVVRIVQ